MPKPLRIIPNAVRLAAGVFISCLLMSAQQAPTYRIAGQLVRDGNNRPVKGARMTVSQVAQPDRQVSCITGENGYFAFTDVPAGKYSLAVNYGGISLGYKQMEDLSTAIAVGPGLDSEHILFPLEAPATIAGTVLDEAGDPVRGAMVHLFGRAVNQGAARTEMRGIAGTDSDGSFHFAHLTPGTYYVAVSGRPWYAQMPQPRALPTGEGQAAQPEQAAPAPEFDVAYPVTYYNGTTSAASATPLQVAEGTRTEIQFRLQPVPAIHATWDRIEKQPDQQVFGTVSQIGPGGTLVDVQAWFNGSMISGIAPGDYVISASLAGSEAKSLGTQAVSLNGNVNINGSEATKTTVSGKVIVAGDVPKGLAVLLENTSNASRAFAFAGQDGSFSIPEVSPAGHYELRLANTEELYVQAVAVKGAPYSNGVLDVTTGAQIEMTINAARGVSNVDGIALRNGKPFAGAMVLFIAHDFRRSNYIPRDQSDSDGTFTANWTAPGRYTVVAIDNGHDLEYANPSVIAPYLAGGRVVDVPLAKDTKLEIEVQGRR